MGWLFSYTKNKSIYQYKNDWPLQDACALVIDMCAGQLERPNIPANNSSFSFSYFVAGFRAMAEKLHVMLKSKDKDDKKEVKKLINCVVIFLLNPQLQNPEYADCWFTGT